MPLLLTEDDVKSILTMPLAMDLTERSFLHLAEGSPGCIRARACTCPVVGFSITWLRPISPTATWG